MGKKHTGPYVNRFFKWLLKKSRDVSSLLALVIGLTFINLFNYQLIRENLLLLIPFLILIGIGMRVLEDAFARMLGKRNTQLSHTYFFVAIFIVIMATTVTKSIIQ
jgi:hypothetical protein